MLHGTQPLIVCGEMHVRSAAAISPINVDGTAATAPNCPPAGHSMILGLFSIIHTSASLIIMASMWGCHLAKLRRLTKSWGAPLLRFCYAQYLMVSASQVRILSLSDFFLSKSAKLPSLLFAATIPVSYALRFNPLASTVLRVVVAPDTPELLQQAVTIHAVVGTVGNSTNFNRPRLRTRRLQQTSRVHILTCYEAERVACSDWDKMPREQVLVYYGPGDLLAILHSQVRIGSIQATRLVAPVLAYRARQAFNQAFPYIVHPTRRVPRGEVEASGRRVGMHLLSDLPLFMDAAPARTTAEPLGPHLTSANTAAIAVFWVSKVVVPPSRLAYNIEAEEHKSRPPSSLTLSSPPTPSKHSPFSLCPHHTDTHARMHVSALPVPLPIQPPSGDALNTASIQTQAHTYTHDPSPVLSRLSTALENGGLELAFGVRTNKDANSPRSRRIRDWGAGTRSCALSKSRLLHLSPVSVFSLDGYVARLPPNPSSSTAPRHTDRQQAGELLGDRLFVGLDRGSTPRFTRPFTVYIGATVPRQHIPIYVRQLQQPGAPALPITTRQSEKPHDIGPDRPVCRDLTWLPGRFAALPLRKPPPFDYYSATAQTRKGGARTRHRAPNLARAEHQIAQEGLRGSRRRPERDE
ncbi:hypothetical protein HRG_012537 [Hirsutella rhossiliensis]